MRPLEKSLYGFSPLGPRVRVGQICWDCELESSWILLMVDLRVVDISGFDIIFDMDKLTAHRVVSDCDLRRSSLTHQRYLSCVGLHMHVI